MFSRDVLRIDPEHETSRIVAAIREQTIDVLGRRGLVVGLSGGVDSSVVAALAELAVGAQRTLGILMPDRDSSPDSAYLASAVVARFGIESITEDVDAALDAIGCFERQVAAVRQVCPEFGERWRFKIVVPSTRGGNRLNLPQLVVRSPDGEEHSIRMSPEPYRQLVAATNFKQRLRATVEYFHADRLHYAVAGTANLLEYDQGFFVKQGDGAADLKPIAHLYKSQVYELAAHLGVPEEIVNREPTTDTFSLPQSQDEFYFGLPPDLMDLCLWAWKQGVPAAEAAVVIGLEVSQVERAYRDIRARHRQARYLHAGALLVPDAASS
jgi:NAD+ synthase